ncbi:hypothetical protein LEMLEM_LOCUS11601, partial [Lemmus lemmus]
MERSKWGTRKTEITDIGTEKPCFPDIGKTYYTVEQRDELFSWILIFYSPCDLDK